MALASFILEWKFTKMVSLLVCFFWGVGGGGGGITLHHCMPLFACCCVAFQNTPLLAAPMTCAVSLKRHPRTQVGCKMVATSACNDRFILLESPLWLHHGFQLLGAIHTISQGISLCGSNVIDQDGIARFAHQVCSQATVFIL
jgi:hypothetical protein